MNSLEVDATNWQENPCFQIWFYASSYNVSYQFKVKTLNVTEPALASLEKAEHCSSDVHAHTLLTFNNFVWLLHQDWWKEKEKNEKKKKRVC